jgi:DNA-binding NtrC family response regulator
VGGTRDLRVAVRIIAATNKDLAAEVEAGRFRRDLYFRLKVIPIEIPPLRARPEDIAPLAEALHPALQRRVPQVAAGPRSWSPRADARLRLARQRARAAQCRSSAQVLLSDRPWIAPADLPTEMRASEARSEPASSGEAAFRLPDQGLSLDELEREMLRQALERTRGNRTQAARLLGMNRDRIRYRIQKFNLEDAVREAP